MGIRHCGAVRCAPEAAEQRGPKRRGDGEDVRAEPPPAGGRHRSTGLGRAGGGLVQPCGFDENHMPVGMQLIGPRFGEQTLLNAGLAFEQASGLKNIIAAL